MSDTADLSGFVVVLMVPDAGGQPVAMVPHFCQVDHPPEFWAGWAGDLAEAYLRHAFHPLRATPSACISVERRVGADHRSPEPFGGAIMTERWETTYARDDPLAVIGVGMDAAQAVREMLA